MATASQSIREIVSMQASAAAVLERFEIDLCSQANVSLMQACAKLQLSVDQVLDKLEDARADEAGAPPVDPACMPLAKLVQHIVRLHHRTIRQELPRLSELAAKLAGKHGERAPELLKIAQLFHDLQRELVPHIEKEENFLFPYVVHLDQEWAFAESSDRGRFKRVSQPVRTMMHEHDSTLELLQRLRALTKDFEVPSWACATFASFYAGLRAFEADLRQHIHLEDDVLFPRAVELENAIQARVQA